MAYDASKLTAVSSNNGRTIWHYSSPDVLTTVSQDGYFDDAWQRLTVDDTIIIDCSGQESTAFVCVISISTDDVEIRVADQDIVSSGSAAPDVNTPGLIYIRTSGLLTLYVRRLGVWTGLI